MAKKTALLIAVFLMYSGFAFAAAIKDIKVIGNERVNSDYIYSLITLKNGDKYDQDLVALSIKNLYNTDRFSNVDVNFSHNILAFTVQENPIVNQITFSGNKSIKQDALTKELTLSKNLPFSTRKLSADKKRINDLYLKSGFMSAAINAKIETLKYNRVNVVFNINEGKKSTIASIKFIGNDSFSSYTLKKVILTREDRWWRFLNPNYIYDSNRISYDAELLRQFYNNNGFIDFNLLSSFVTINKDNQYQLIFNLNEGQRFKFDTLKLDIKIDRLKPYQKELQKLLVIKNGPWFSKNEVDRIIATLKNQLNKLGFNLVEVNPVITPDSFLKNVAVTFEIKESKENTIENINISGNSKTYDSVIRRALDVREGDAFNQDTVNTARVNAYNLGYFSDVNVTSSPGSMPDKTLLNVKVSEQSTGYISLGGGYSTYDGFMLQASYSEQNIMGSGNGINLTASLSERQINFDATLFNPYLFDRKVYGSIRAFNTVTDYTQYSAYKLNEVGISPSLGYKLSPNLSQTFTYSLSNVSIFNVSDSAPLSIKESAGNRVSSIISHNLQYDRRDNVIYPTRGYLVGLNTDVAGLGGNVYYLRNTLTSSWYQALYGNVVFSAVGSTGYINKIRQDKDILISDKFFLGGTTLRGFDWSGVGPRDPNTGDALGGNYMLRFSEQIDFPIPVVENFGLLFHVFNDNGTVYNIDTINKDIVKSMQIRSSVGFGLSWRSPFGLIALDWGWPIKKEPGDKTQRFLLSFGARL